MLREGTESRGTDAKNLMAQSQSRTGKTAAFVLAMLSRVDPAGRLPQVGSIWNI